MEWKNIKMSNRLAMLKQRRTSNPNYKYSDLRNEFVGTKDNPIQLPEVTITASQSYENRTTPEQRKELIDSINNNSNAEFIGRLKSGEAGTNLIPDWENRNRGASLKMSSTKVDGRVIVFPMVQKINNKLFDFSDPKNNTTFEDARNSALDTGDYVEMPSDAAVWFSNNNYKHYYPQFEQHGYKRYDSGKTPLMYQPAQYKSTEQIGLPSYIYTNPIQHNNISPIVSNEPTYDRPISNPINYNAALPEQTNSGAWKIPTYNNSNYNPSNNIRRKIINYEGSTMRTNAPISKKANELKSMLGDDLVNYLSPEQLDSLTSYYYNIKPQSFIPTLKQVRRLQSVKNENEYNNVINDISNSINVGYGSKGMRGLTRRRQYERNLFVNRKYDKGKDQSYNKI